MGNSILNSDFACFTEEFAGFKWEFEKSQVTTKFEFSKSIFEAMTAQRGHLSDPMHPRLSLPNYDSL